jgi:hypothetical protein
MEINVLGQKMRLELIVLAMLVGAFMVVNVWCSTAGGVKEGFNAGVNLAGSALDYVMGSDVKGSWTSPQHLNKQYGYNTWFKDLETNRGGPVPLPEGQLFMFGENEYKPECCPSTYSGSTGCVCVSAEQKKYLNERGGNRTFNTEF